MRADGTILIDTSIVDDGFEAGTRKLQDAAKNMAKSVDKIGATAKAALQKQLNSFMELNIQYSNQAEKVEALRQKLKELGSQKVKSDAYKAVEKEIDDINKKLDTAVERQIKFVETGGKTNSRTFKAMEYDIEKLNEQLDEAKKRKEEMEKSGGAYEAGTSTREYQSASEELDREEQKLENMFTRLGNAWIRLKSMVSRYGGSLDAAKEKTKSCIGIVDVAKKSISGLWSLIKKAPHGAVKLLALGFKGLAAAVKGAASVLKKVGGYLVKMSAGILGIHKSANKSTLSLKNMLKYAFGIRSLYALFNKLRSGIVDGFNNLVQYSDSTNKSISGLMSALTQLKNSFATAFAPILTVIAPALTYLINLLTSATTALAQFMAALTGQGTFVKAKKIQQDYAKSLKGTAGAAEKAEGALASFDKLNVQQNDSSGGGASGGVNPSDMFETAKVENNFKNIADKIRAYLQAQDWNGLGEYMAHGINSGLQKVYDIISWDNVGPKITAFATAFTTTFNSLVDNIDWDLLGRTVGAGVNTIANTLMLFVDGIDWKNLGVKIGEGANGLVDEIDWNNLGQLFIAKMNIVIDLLYGFVETFDFTQFGTAIGTAIQGAVDSIDPATYAEALSGAAIGIFDGITAALVEIDWQEVGEKIAEFFRNIDYSGISDSFFTMLGAALGSLGEFVYGLFHDGMEAYWAYFQKYLNEYGGNVAKAWLEGAKNVWRNIGAWVKEHIFTPFIDGIKRAFEIHSPSKVMIEQGGYVAQGLLEGITNFIPNILEKFGEIKDKIVEKWDETKTATKNKWDEIKQSVSESCDGLKSASESKLSSFKTMITNTWDDLREKTDSIWGTITETVSGAIDKIKQAGKKVGSAMSGAMGIDTYSTNFALPTSQNVYIPKLASGTVVPPRAGEFAAILGDNRKETEVVSPLSTMKQAMLEALEEAGGMGGGDIVGYIYLDGKEMGQSTVKFVRQEKKRTGKNPLLA